MEGNGGGRIECCPAGEGPFNSSGGWLMKYGASIVAVLALCGLCASAQQHAGHAETKAVTLVSGLGDLHHPVSTSNPEAQKFFDQGLRYIFAFNHEEAARSFQHA